MNNINFNKINILLIEDNPKQFEKLIETGGKINLKNFEHLADNFTLKLFQHPIEVKEFIYNYPYLLDNYTYNEIGNIQGLLPELIVFDYKLSENIEIDTNDNSIHYDISSKNLREKLNPNYIIIENLNLKNKGFILTLDNQDTYDLENFITDINNAFKIETAPTNNEAEVKKEEQAKKVQIKKDKAELENDELGLYCGISIWNMFKDYTSVCIPATHNKDKIEKLNAHSKFYEWLYEGELSEMFLETNRGDKTWDTILPKAMKHFRNRIIELAKRGKITFDLDNLYKIGELKNEDALAKTGLSIFSIYGAKCYCVDALFIDSTANKLDVVKRFINDVLEIFELTSETYKTVDEKYKYIWGTFEKKFENIFDLSFYILKYKIIGENKFNDQAKKKELEKLNSDTSNNQTAIDNLKKDLEEYENYKNLLTKYVENGDYKKALVTSVFELKKVTDEEKRKIALLLITKLYLQYVKAKHQFGETVKQPTNEEYAYVLSPIRSEYTIPLLLEAHREFLVATSDISKTRNILKETVKDIKSLLGKISKEKDNKTLDFELTFHNKFLSKEKKFALNYFGAELKKINKQDYPEWLK